MHFAFTPEQEALRAEARRWLEERYPHERVAELADSEAGWDPASWAELAELGWLGCVGGGGRGRRRARLPRGGCAVRGARARALPGAVLLDGRARAAGARARGSRCGRGRRGALVGAGRRARPRPGARRPRAHGRRRGVAAEGETRRRRWTRPAGSGGSRPGCGRRREIDRPRVRTALALEAVGIAQRALDWGVEHAKDRQQFGKSIGVYQAVSHSLVDAMMATELARSLAYWAAWCVAESDEQARDGCRRREGVRLRGGRLRVRALDPGARRDRLHVGAPAAPVLQARAVDPGLRRVPGRAAGRDRRRRSLAKTVLITGASSGIGAACATRLAAKGWEVHAGVRTPGDAPPGTTEVILDVTDPPPLEFERLDGLVNNAGIAIAAPLEDLPLDELRRQLEVNVVGQLAVTQAVLPALRAARGRIVIVGSIAGRSALPFLGAYAISKFALEAMSDSLRLEVAPGRDRGLARRARDDPHGDLDEAAAARRRRLRAVPGAGRAVPAGRGGPGRQGRAGRPRHRRDRARAHRRAPEDALPRRPGREDPRPDREAARPRARPRAHTRVAQGLSATLTIPVMRGQMMDFQLTLPHILRRVETYYPGKEIVTRLPDKSFHRYGYGDMARRAKQLAVALQGLGLERGDRVGRSAGTTTSTTRPTSASRAAGSCCTR